MNDQRTRDDALRPEKAVDALRPADLAEISAELTERAGQLREEITASDEAVAALRADCDLDAADAGTKIAAAQQLRARRDEAHGLLQQTLGALDRLRNGTFGARTSCGRPVGAARLRAVPHAERCIACTRTSEPPRSR
jgi:DnaK suppressor protein